MALRLVFVLVLAAVVSSQVPGCPPTVPPANGPLADLRVDSDYLAKSWVIKYEEFDNSTCEVKESKGLLTGGPHKVVRFSVSTPNYGAADISIGDPTTCHFNLNDGLFEYATCHAHFHFLNYATYELFNAAGTLVTESAKRGFCMIDIQQAQGYVGDQKGKTYKSCGSLYSLGNQGITAGWSDIYDRSLPGQLFNLDGLAPEEYTVRITVNPRYCVVNKKKCPAGDAACAELPACPTCANAEMGCCQGQRGFEVVGPVVFCHMLRESDYTNNVGQAVISVPSDADTHKAGNIGPGSASASEPSLLAKMPKNP